jgi:hypothetical protein
MRQLISPGGGLLSLVCRLLRPRSELGKAALLLTSGLLGSEAQDWPASSALLGTCVAWASYDDVLQLCGVLKAAVVPDSGSATPSACLVASLLLRSPWELQPPVVAAVAEPGVAAQAGAAASPAVPEPMAGAAAAAEAGPGPAAGPAEDPFPAPGQPGPPQPGKQRYTRRVLKMAMQCIQVVKVCDMGVGMPVDGLLPWLSLLAYSTLQGHAGPHSAASVLKRIDPWTCLASALKERTLEAGYALRFAAAYCGVAAALPAVFASKARAGKPITGRKMLVVLPALRAEGHEELARAVVGLSALAGLYGSGRADAAAQQATARLAEAREAFLGVWPQLAPGVPIELP